MLIGTGELRGEADDVFLSGFYQQAIFEKEELLTRNVTGERKV